MGTIEVIGGALLILMSVVLCIIVLMQEGSKGGGVAALSGGSTDSFLNRNPGRTRDKMLYSITRFCAIVFFVLTIVVHAVNVR